MNAIQLKITLASAVLVGLGVHANMAMAASLKGSLGAGAQVMDVYTVTCSSNSNGATDHLNLNILNTSAVSSSLLSVQAFKGILTASTTDAVAGNTTTSPTIAIKSGNGAYRVYVDKAAAGAESYTLNYTCLNSVAKATGVAIATLQNQ